MAAAAFLQRQMTAGQVLTGQPSPMATSGTSGSGASGDSNDSATISANDFLTLLVTEMQNQDPTADTDPNEYINQLVEVNSLEQLIDINQTLSSAMGASASTTGGTASSQAVPGGTGPAAAGAASAAEPPAALKTSLAPAVGGPGSPAVQRAPGNLSVPAANAASRQVGHALDGRTSRHMAVTRTP